MVTLSDGSAIENGRMPFFPVVLRQPLFRQNHFLISSKRAAAPASGSSISLPEVAKIPLVLPGALNARRIVIDRTSPKRACR